MKNSVNEIELACDALAVIAKLGESRVGRCAGRIGAADQVLVDEVLLVVGECECDFSFYEHGRESVICAGYEFFDDNVVFAGAAASVSVGFAGFIGVCGAVDSLASGEVDRFYDNRERQLRNGGLEVGCVSNNVCARCRNVESCSEGAVLVFVVDFETRRIGIVPREPELFADVRC